ncbi:MULTISPECIES: tRNA (adenosine(37)-N6)-dimethylallyltransferase MiaA [Anaerococcus]|uniref:tRNA (adenosine(37)-N6)-dimethylallyltransferase MiaA n=1 Tax=Anaerococcus TaxID=165779 RepID=UPI0024332D18|nr:MULTISPECIES: tRNA (adenosine(37)-N6)-dimethylallyltransferase MiaA [Anaerococcus]MDD7766382.1 tRNA (adenosine(37)-N6)-dimethylallyltransferase MiaA [Anaerococcus vaginalis]MDY6128107.1 tRNA (adenosine(37)-N6)-dimethylallyltransferase MiaA [Anaerococcus sp.]
MIDKVLIVTGPTACGKSDFAIKLAKKFDGEIISADSQQIYKDMDIGTNKIKESETDGIKHYGLDIKYPNEEYSVQEFKDMARNLISEINSKNKIPIVAGGTGFYIDSILFDMNYGTNKKDENLRDKLTKDFQMHGNEYMYEKFCEIDPIEAKKYHPNETQRIIRAFETYKLTGKKPSELRKGLKNLNKNIKPILFFINYKDRSKLYEKINLRVDQMINDGLENEFDFVAKKYKLSPLSKSLQAIGYKEFFPYKENEISYDELRSEIKKNTRRYAKRQITWMKKYLKYDFSHLIYRDEDMDEKILENMEKIVKETYDLQ